jgi:hypothetical protein
VARSAPGDRGAVAVSTALMMVALFGFFALAFNIGVMMDTRGELQNAADSAALAAARSLDGQASGLDAARRSASAYSLRHTAFGDAVTIDPFGADLSFGRWHLRRSECVFGDAGGECFEPLSTTEPRKITAVKIGNGRDGGSHNLPLELPFGALFGRPTTTVVSAAVAVGAGAAAVDCTLPLVVPECKIINLAGRLECTSGQPQRLVFSNANADAVGFINMFFPGEEQSPSGSFVADVIRDRPCNPDKFQIGPAKLHEGNDFDKVVDALRGVTKRGQGNQNVDRPCLIGTTQTMAVTDAGCPGNPIFHGVQEVVGFVKAKIVAVTDNHSQPLACPGDPPPPLEGPMPMNGVFIDILCDAPAGADELAGGRAFNSSDVRIRLVQ